MLSTSVPRGHKHVSLVLMKHERRKHGTNIIIRGVLFYRICWKTAYPNIHKSTTSSDPHSNYIFILIVTLLSEIKRPCRFSDYQG